MSQAFSAAAYRFGHSLVQEEFLRLSQRSFEHKCSDDSKSEFYPIPVKDFGNPTYLYDKCNGGVDSIFRGLVKSPAAKIDGWVSRRLIFDRTVLYVSLAWKKQANRYVFIRRGKGGVIRRKRKSGGCAKTKQFISRKHRTKYHFTQILLIQTFYLEKFKLRARIFAGKIFPIR